METSKTKSKSEKIIQLGSIMDDSSNNIQNENEWEKKDEIEQTKVEKAIEKIQKGILSRSHLYVNIIFVIFGAYALVLSGIYFTNSSTLTSLEASSSYPMGIFFLCFSLAALLMAYVALARGFSEMNKVSLGKLKLQLNIQGKMIQREIPQVNVNYTIRLKNGSELVNYNKKMYDITKDLILYNDQSEGCILLSLLCFGAFFSLIENSTPTFYLLVGIFVLIILLFTWTHSNRKNRNKKS